MEALPWFWIWIVLAAILCIGEMFTLSFFLLPFAVGAIVTAIAQVFGADLVVQWVIFVVVSIIALIALRPVAKRITKTTKVKSGVERLIGSVGEVIEGDAPHGLFRIRVEREEWNACLDDKESDEAARITEGQPAIGSKVKVIGVDGTRLIVIPVSSLTDKASGGIPKSGLA